MTKTIELLRELESYWRNRAAVHPGSLLAEEVMKHLRELEAQAAARQAVEVSICNNPKLGDYVHTESLGMTHCVSEDVLSVVQCCINRGEDCRYATEAEWLEHHRNLTMCEACGSQTHHADECCYHQRPGL